MTLNAERSAPHSDSDSNEQVLVVRVAARGAAGLGLQRAQPLVDVESAPEALRPRGNAARG